MRGWRVWVVMVGLAVSTGSSTSLAQERGFVVEHGVEAAAPRTVSLDDLGRPYTASFQSAGDRPLFSEVAGARRESTVSDVHISYELIENDAKLKANAGVWGLGDARLRATSRNAYSVHRVYLIRREVSFEAHHAPAAIPAGARYYLSSIVYGHMYEVHFHGSRETLDAGIGAIFPGGQFSAGAQRSATGIQYGINMRGLEPTGDDAIFATESEVRERFRPTGEPEPILVTYRPIPGADQLAEARGPSFVELTLREANVRSTKANGSAWDAGLGAARRPDVRLEFVQGGEVIACFSSHNSNRILPSDGLVARAIAVSPTQPLVVRLVDTDGFSADDAIGRLRIGDLQPATRPLRLSTAERAGDEPMATVDLIVRRSDAASPELLGARERACGNR